MPNACKVVDFGLYWLRYCFNNPLIYTDPDGEWVHIVVGAAIGGVINLATNWNSVDNFWEGLAAFGAGAGQGALTAAFGPVGAMAGGALTGATNATIAQTGNGVGLGDVNWGQVGLSAGVGGVAGVAGYGAGQWASSNLGGVLINGFHVSANSALGGAITGAVGGAVGGYAGGFTGGLLMTGDVSAAHQAGIGGMWMGAGIGGGAGAVGGYVSAKRAGLNPWTGKPNKSIGIGEGQTRVDGLSRYTDSETISNDWQKASDAHGRGENFGGDRLQGKSFNKDWMVGKIEEGYIIYDFGPDGRAIPSQNYNLELRTIQGLNYNQNHYRVIIHYRTLILYK